MYTVNFIFAEKQNLKRKKSSDLESDLDGMLPANYNVYKLPRKFITAT